MIVGELACLGAALMWAIAVTMFRAPIATYGARTINLVKGLVATGLLAVTVLVVGSWRDLTLASPSELGFLAASGLVGLTLGDTALFAAVARVGVHRALLLQTTAPLFAAAIAFAVLGERLHELQVAGGLTVLVGVSLVVTQKPTPGPAGSPAGRGLALGLALGVLGAFGQGAGVVLAKLGLVQMPVLPATLVRLAVASAGLLVMAALGGKLGNLAAALGSAPNLARLLPAAFLGTYLAMLLLMLGVDLAPASVAAVLLATPPVFSLVIEAAGQRRLPSAQAVLGTVIAVAGVSLITAAG